jgi:hypothetical protein
MDINEISVNLFSKFRFKTELLTKIVSKMYNFARSVSKKPIAKSLIYHVFKRNIDCKLQKYSTS